MDSPDDEPVKFDRLSQLDKKVAFLTKKWSHLDDQYSKILFCLQALQLQFSQLSNKTEMVTELKSMVKKYLKDPERTPDFLSIWGDHERRILTLEELLAKLTEKSVWLTSQFASNSYMQVLLHDLEQRIIQRFSYHLREMNTRPSPELMMSIMSQSGITGISEAQAHTIVNDALNLYSEDKTSMADFALESAGGSVVNTRCSENYDTKTAVISLFGVPLWYFSQSPRAVIQPDMYPRNCWSFRGSQGHLVIQLSRKIQPMAFTLEHILKSLTPNRNIESALEDFAVYGLADEYQEEGVLLGQYRYDQDGSALQMFQVTEPVDKAYQMVEFKILSNWGNAEYTCLYRFRMLRRVTQ